MFFLMLLEKSKIRTGYEINISLSPFAFERINRELDMGRQDCKVFLLDGAKDSIIVVGSSIFDIPMGVIAKKGLSLVDRSSLKGVKVSTLKPLSEGGKFMDDDFFDKILDANYSVGLKKLAHGRVDAVAGAIPTIMFLAKSEDMENDVGMPLLLSYEKIFFQCSKDSKKIKAVKIISNIVEKMKEEGVLEEVVSENNW